MFSNKHLVPLSRFRRKERTDSSNRPGRRNGSVCRYVLQEGNCSYSVSYSRGTSPVNADELMFRASGYGYVNATENYIYLLESKNQCYHSKRNSSHQLSHVMKMFIERLKTPHIRNSNSRLV